VTGSFNSGGGLTHMATGDFNGDGVADLVIGFGLNASVLLGLGGGQFGPPQALPEYYNALFGFAIADFNLDGKPDLAALTDDDFDGVSNVFISLGNGDGTFQPFDIYSPNYNCEGGPVVADFNHDGIPDLAVTGNVVSVFLGRGDGTLNPRKD